MKGVEHRALLAGKITPLSVSPSLPFYFIHCQQQALSGALESATGKMNSHLVVVERFVLRCLSLRFIIALPF